ncbi:LysR family transcriptional regulator [Paraburkholderia guartelaensis]|uniref:LysR family transcriptional regulator n=1 Tax=Paraburkholderia guartelaensis TaxID=2546446 RepID=A0A4R5L3J6_9BURK|nr:LysR family transcriptional regulator [Paraburkholderia guartelaensis]TDG02382.1 LysR family transcriptional regulator [Paraburkholderia guartelaensis]
MNWDDARIFVALRRERTLRAAARSLDIDQATVGRRLAALEHALGATLFLRTSNGYELTPVGGIAIRAAEAMEQSAHDLVRHAQGVDKRHAGEVKLSTTDALAEEYVIPAIQRLHAKHPDVSVMLDTTTVVLNLAKREADIAIRTVKPRNADLLARRLASWEVGLFASPDYVRRHGEPEPGERFAGHDLVVYQPHFAKARVPAFVGEPLKDGRVVARLNTNLTLRAAVKAGLGISELPVPMGERDGLVRIWPDRSNDARYEIWLVTHQDLRHTARIRVTIDEIVFAFGA